MSDSPAGTRMRLLRDRLLRGPRAQAVVRHAARAGLVPGAVLRRLQPLGPHPVATPAGNTVVYVAERTDVLARSVVWPGEWEAASLRLFSELAVEARCVLDVGAFTGIYSLIAAADSPSAEVIAFEPNPGIAPALRRNLEANSFADRISVREVAVSDVPGRALLSVPADTTGALIGGDPADPSFEVEVTTLDLSAAGRPVDLVKMDIEGREAAALRGASGLLAERQPDIVVELLTEAAFADVAGILGELGYEAIRHLGAGGAQEVDGFVDEPRHANYHFARPTG